MGKFDGTGEGSKLVGVELSVDASTEGENVGNSVGSQVGVELDTTVVIIVRVCDDAKDEERRMKNKTIKLNVLEPLICGCQRAKFKKFLHTSI